MYVIYVLLRFKTSTDKRSSRNELKCRWNPICLLMLHKLKRQQIKSISANPNSPENCIQQSNSSSVLIVYLKPATTNHFPSKYGIFQQISTCLMRRNELFSRKKCFSNIKCVNLSLLRHF